MLPKATDKMCIRDRQRPDLLCAVCSEWLCVFYCGRSPGVYRKMYAQGKACLLYTSWDTPTQSPTYPDFWITFRGVRRGITESDR